MPVKKIGQGDSNPSIRMDLQYTLQRFALQLKNKPRTLRRGAGVFQKIIKTLYEAYFPNAEARRPGPNPNCPDADILTVAWLLEYIGEDSENLGYRRIQGGTRRHLSGVTGAIAFQSSAKASIYSERSPPSGIDELLSKDGCFYR